MLWTGRASSVDRLEGQRARRGPIDPPWVDLAAGGWFVRRRPVHSHRRAERVVRRRPPRAPDVAATGPVVRRRALRRAPIGPRRVASWSPGSRQPVGSVVDVIEPTPQRARQWCVVSAFTNTRGPMLRWPENVVQVRNRPRTCSRVRIHRFEPRFTGLVLRAPRLLRAPTARRPTTPRAAQGRCGPSTLAQPGSVKRALTACAPGFSTAYAGLPCAMRDVLPASARRGLKTPRSDEVNRR